MPNVRARGIAISEGANLIAARSLAAALVVRGCYRLFILRWRRRAGCDVVRIHAVAKGLAQVFLRAGVLLGLSSASIPKLSRYDDQSWRSVQALRGRASSEAGDGEIGDEDQGCRCSLGWRADVA